MFGCSTVRQIALALADGGRKPLLSVGGRKPKLFGIAQALVT